MKEFHIMHNQNNMNPVTPRKLQLKSLEGNGIFKNVAPKESSPFKAGSNGVKTDFIVIGSGIAGLNFALGAAKRGRVVLLTKKDVMESNTNYAQGGMAAVLDKDDTFEAHIRDTLKAGCYHNDRKAVEFLVKQGPKMIKKLLELGTPFERQNGVLKLTREGAHNCRRVAYAGDSTGHAIEKTLIRQVSRDKRIKVLENSLAVDLIVRHRKCYGVIYLKGRKIKKIYGKAVVLATGGAGALFEKTTNPDIATADGIAMAFRAGAKVEDLEFIQFHPTALNKAGAPPFLISEAVRGEGGKLKNFRGEEFMAKYHPDKELAPRDIVARAIVEEAQSGTVALDISHKDPAILKNRFPTIYKKLLEYGIDMTKEAIPVLPAAHYMCGGVKVNLNGETNIKNLYAFGETARTGVHGANRLASNSLLESMVFSNQVLSAVKKLRGKVEEVSAPLPNYIEFDASDIKKEIRQIMWRNVGLLRTDAGLRLAIRKLEEIGDKLPAGVNGGLAEAKNMVQVGRLIALAALKRKKSLGCHFRSDNVES